MNEKTLSYLSILSVILVGLFAGVLFTAGLAISPSLGQLDASNFALVKQAQIRILQASMSTVTTVYFIVALVLLYGAKKSNRPQFFKFTLWALILVAIALIYSAFTDIPYNQQILKWDVTNPPADWETVRDKWDLANYIRAIPTMLGFIAQSIALLFVKND